MSCSKASIKVAKQSAQTTDDMLRAIVIDKRMQFLDLRTADINFKQLHTMLELADLLEKLSLLGLNLLLVVGLLAHREKHAGYVEGLPLEPTHLNGVNGVTSDDILIVL
jgi:hypothetical protein